MRITRLDLERYGRFADKTLLLRPDAPLHVVLGSNEGGKTTALTAISDLLFGFSPSTSYNFLHDNKALRIGAELLLRNGDRLNFRRRKGNLNTLLDAKDQPLPDDYLARVIGSVSREAFNKEFGLTTASLRLGGEELLKAGGKLAETLATGSAGLSALSAVKETIAREADELFTARRSGSKEFYVALSRYEEADKKLKAAIVTADAMHEAEAQFEAAKVKKKQIETEHQNLSGQHRRLERTVRTRKTIGQIDKLSDDLLALSGLQEVAQTTVQTWRKALGEYQQLVTDLGKLELQDADDLSTINDLATDETLIAFGYKIDKLRERLGAIKQSRDDLPKRQGELAAAKSTLENTARRLGLSNLAALFDQRPSDLALTRAEELANARDTADDRLIESEDTLSKAVADLRTIEETDKSAEQPVDPAIFRQRLEAVSHVPTSADRLKRETSSCDGDEREQLVAGRVLAPQIGSLAEFSALQVPGLANIERFKLDLLDLQQQGAKALAEHTTLQQKLSSIAAKMERLKRDGTQVTRDDLEEIRGHRDMALDQLDKVIDDELSARRNAFGNLVSASNKTDVITDELLRDSARATQLQTLKDEHADTLQALAAAEHADSQWAEKLAQLDAIWKDLWVPSQVLPTSPAEMINWRQKFDTIVDAAKKINNRRNELVTLRQELDEAAIALATLMQDYGRPRDKTTAPQIIFSEANAWLTALQENWTKLRERGVTLVAATKSVEQAKVEKEKRAKAVDNVSIQWEETLAAIGLPIAASSLEVRTAVGLWKDIVAPNQSYHDLEHRISSMQRDIDIFVREVDAVNAATSQNLQGEAEIILKTLTDRLAHAREAAQKRHVLREQMEVRNRKRAELISGQQELADLLGNARQVLGTDSNASLTVMLDQLDQRNELSTQLARLKNSLFESGDGVSEETLRYEQAGLDFDILPSEIERIKVEIHDLLGKISDASVNIAATQRAVDELGRGRNATGFARDLQDASGELEMLSRKWIVRAAAERLAARAIEKYRASVQDPLLARAGTLFKSATAEAFSGLDVEFDDRDQPSLTTVRKNGEHVPVSGLSEGTRDQLFLSLRLALLSMRTAEALPFIADDLLSSFDEERTGRTLLLLCEFGRTTQVIVFTHHVHVANIARSVVPECEIVAL